MTSQFLKATMTALALVMAVPAMAGAQTLTMGVRAGPDSIDPHWSTLGSQAETLRHVFDTLVGVDNNLQLQPAIATSWKPTGEDSWEFKIREGVKFHNGEPLTAEDVKFSIERIPRVTGPMSTTIYTKRVKSVEVVDPYTLRVVTNGTAPSLPNDFIRLFIVPKSTGEAKNDEFNSGAKAIGTGPYKFVSWTPKGDFVAERNEDYWGEKPHWQRVVRREIPDDAARVAALRSGGVDLINYVPASDYQSIKADGSLQTFISDSLYILNVQPVQGATLPQKVKVDGKPIDANPFADLKVRTALDKAIDRKTLVRVVLEGLGKPANQLMPEGFFGYSAELPEPQYDLKGAKALLAEAGYPNGFEFDFTCTNNRVPGDAVVCEALAQMWSRAGLKVNANALNGTVFFPASQRGDYSVQMSAWGTITGEASYTYGSMVHTADKELGLGAFNRTGYSNKQFDTLFEEGQRTLDDEKRRSIFEQTSKIAMEDRALIPTVILQTVWAAKANTVDFQPRVDQETLAYLIKPAK
ncbi:ABC transporter substrate-binding protein [Aureimonas sp. AU4]|uniref:ABC transporter substrate-binding protein n=1 Tax=Aureimonas sp. AU4 TaxID=1638163 RepID=UPI000782F551|nr:ABC transporter substrate-binding protein [Aureimonas sp. AU4]